MAITAASILPAAIASAQTPWPQDTKNPSLIIETVPMPATYMTMGLSFMADGRLVVATTGTEGGGEIPAASADSKVMIVGGLTGDMSGLSVKTVADMWKQPAGVTIVGDKVYVSERDGFYQIQSLDNPGTLSGNRAKIIGWPAPDAGLKWTVSEQWHQWVHTPVYYGGKFYGPYGGSIQVGGRSNTPPTSTYSGAFVSWNPDGSGGLTKITGGFRVPNGMNLTPSGQFFVSDNQGSWLPACTFNLIKPNKFYGHRQTSPNQANWAESLPYEPPVMWLVDGVHQSASQPLYLDKGPYAGDFIIGDDNSPGLSRVALDKVSDGNYNGAMFFFTGGFSTAAINRLAMHTKEEAIVVGTFLAAGDWPAGGTKPMYRIKFGTTAAFEMREIHSRQGGVEIVFSKPLNASTAVAGNFTLSQWHYNRTSEYGCCIDGDSKPNITAVQLSEDRKRLYLAVNGGTAATDRLLKFVVAGIKSETGEDLFHNTAYFSHNYQSNAAFVSAPVGVAAKDGNTRANFMDLAVGHTVLPGMLRVKVDLPGGYSVSVHALNGSMVEERKGSGPAEFIFPSQPGTQAMKVLQVKQDGHSYIRPVFY
jgi:hypothetical protein